MSRTTAWLIAGCAWMAIVATAPTATAQDPDEPDDDPAAKAGAEDDLFLGDVTDFNNFDVEQWIFNGQNLAATRRKLEAALTLNLSRFDKKYGLEPAQKKKLELAGRHDIKRYFDRVDAMKSEFRRVKGDWNQVGDQIGELRSIAIRPHSDLFGDNSMLAKTLRKNVTPQQVARYEQGVYRGRVEWLAGLLHSRLVFDTDQRRRFVDLVVEETPPLKRYGSFDYDAIMFQVSRLPREKLRAVLDDGQCRELTLRFDQARRLEGVLVSEGYVSKAAGERDVHREEARR